MKQVCREKKMMKIIIFVLAAIALIPNSVICMQRAVMSTTTSPKRREKADTQIPKQIEKTWRENEIDVIEELKKYSKNNRNLLESFLEANINKIKSIICYNPIKTEYFNIKDEVLYELLNAVFKHHGLMDILIKLLLKKTDSNNQCRTLKSLFASLLNERIE